MQLEHSFTVPAAIDDAWKVLLDIELIAPCMPGAAIDSVDGDDFTGTVKVKLGPIGLTYKGKASFVEKDEATHRAVIDAQGRDARGNGTAKAKVSATLTEQSPSQTKVDVITDLDITGKPAQFGRGVMVDVGNKLIGQFADCLAGKLAGGGPAAEAAAASVAAEPSTTAAGADGAPVAPAGAEDGSVAEAGSDDAPVAEAGFPPPTGAAAAGHGHAKLEAHPTGPTAAGHGAKLESNPGSGAASAHAKLESAPSSRPEVEPINLLESAGPAVAKRLAPIAAAVVLVLIVLRLRRR